LFPILFGNGYILAKTITDRVGI